MSSKNPIISIIVPIYKVEKYLSSCIDSILNQTFTDFELILVNDGSPDNCPQICEEYKEKDSRIIVIHKENGGVSSARNAGLDIAKGEYIGFVDPDDTIDNKMYQVLYEVIEREKADVAVCDFYLVNEQTGDKILNLTGGNSTKIQIFDNLTVLKKFYEQEAYFIVPWNKLYKRNIFNNLKYPLGLIYEDEYIAHRVFHKVDKVVCIPEYLYYYLQRKTSILGGSSNIKKADKVLAKLDRIHYYKQHNLEDLMHRANKDFIDLFFWSYSCIRREEKYNHFKLKEMRNYYRKNYKDFIRGSYTSFREKIVLTIFFISPRIHERLFKLI